MSDVETRFLPLLPLSTGVVLPQMVVPLGLDSDEAKAAADAALAGESLLVLVPRVEHEDGPTVYAKVGTVAKIEETGRLPGGARAVVVRGLHRAILGAAVPGFGEGTSGNGLFVQAEPVQDPSGAPSERARELMKEYRAVVEAILEHRHARPLAEALRGIGDPGTLADSAGYSPDLTFEQRIELLETIDVEERLTKALAWARDALGELELKERIRTDVTEGMEKRQREFMLRQQMDAIRKELGEGDGDVAAEYRAKIADMVMPAAVREAVEREIDRLERTGEQSPEHSWIRTWLDTLTELPWGKRSEDRLDLGDARAILDADHTGLDDVKERIVEHLAVRKLRKERGLDELAPGDEPVPARGGSGAILVLVGPPGVGKTSLGESVARALGRKFVRVALGGVRDEAEIRGHRRTYVGAQAGRLVRALKEAGTMNPVILLDEVDKLANDWRGDPTSALLEVLDPAQNHTFRDHYAEVDLDLSDVLFLATANVLETIPGPLLDRMELLRLDGYTEDEKVTIALGHLLPRQRERNGLQPGEVEVTDAAVRRVVTGYTREAGVRGLERELGRLLRKAAVKLVSSRPPDTAGRGEASATEEPGGRRAGSSRASGNNSPILIDVEDVEKALGRPKFYDEAAERTGVPGVATGLAVTGAGGDVLFVEATSMPAEGGAALAITGQLGDVMKESAEIALSYVRSHAGLLGLPEGSFDKKRFHLHVPAGAVPKDGPSAGVTMTTALVSLLTGRPVKSTVGMTGEVTLSGRVLPIGGVKQKVLAAHRAGLTEVVLPARNGPDLDDVPEAVREAMTFHLAEDVGQVLGWALEDAPPAEAAEAA
ncbi:MAG TPA: endopeptidase La [Acidimicrobiia bacterium]|nr:endopeptidase La [Acidimicrobiia bacterium]